jgi:hypothetical protein
MTMETQDSADLLWCQAAASAVVDELVTGELFDPDQASWAREIVAHTLHGWLVSGVRPPISK